jgi:hypothetical protein
MNLARAAWATGLALGMYSGGLLHYVQNQYLHGAIQNMWIAFSINTVLGAGAATAGAVTGGAHLPVAIGVAVGLWLLSKPQESVVQGIVNKVLTTGVPT